MGMVNMTTDATPVQYMARTRDYYAAQGYPSAYQWAQNDSVPFVRPRKPLRSARLALITTASPMQDRRRGDGVSASGEALLLAKELYSGPVSQPPTALFTDDLSWDKESTHTEDLESFFPLAPLQHLVQVGELGSVAERYHCVPTEYSQRQTLDNDAPTIRERCLEDGVDIALLVPL